MKDYYQIPGAEDEDRTMSVDDILSEYYSDSPFNYNSLFSPGDDPEPEYEAPAEEYEPKAEEPAEPYEEKIPVYEELEEAPAEYEEASYSVDDILSDYNSGASYMDEALLRTLDAGAFSQSDEEEPPKQNAVEEKAEEKPAPRTSSLPSDSDVRDYLASLTSDDFLRFTADEPEPVREPPEEIVAPELNVDDRFHLGGYSRQTFIYGDNEIDFSAEADYAPAKQEGYSPSHWTPEASGDEPVEPYIPKFPGFRKRTQKKAAVEEEPGEDGSDSREYSAEASAPISGDSDDEGFESEFKDYNFSGADNVKAAAKAQKNADGEDDEFFPASFKEYIASVVNTVLFRVRGVSRTTVTIEDKDEYLGNEVPALQASKYYGSYAKPARLRLRLSFILLAVMTWVSLGLPVSGAIKSYRIASLLCLALQLTVMVLSLDIVTNGIMSAVRKKPGFESLAVVFCLLTSLDAFIVGVTSFSSPHVPLCVVSSFSLAGAAYASLLSSRGLRKATRVPAIGKRAYTVTAETDKGSGDITLLKSQKPVTGFVRRSEEAAPDETFFRKAAIPGVLIVLFFSLIVAVARHAYTEIFYICSAFMAPLVPVTGLLCFALPFCTGSNRLFGFGSSVAGWSGLIDIGKSKNLIITDIDLFPESSIELENVRIFADADSEKIIAYAGSIIMASGCDLSAGFADVMERNNCRPRNVNNFQPMAGGGLKAVIDGDVVLCGNTDFMRLMNVKVPYRLVDQTSVLLAVNDILYGIFSVKYNAKPAIREALVSLVRANRHPVFAVRDFNITPAMLRDVFEIATDGYDFPPFTERYVLSSSGSGESSKVTAIVCRDGLAPLVRLADTGKSMHSATIFNVYACAAGIVLGLLSVLIKFLISGTVGVGFLLASGIIFALPIILAGIFAVR